MKIGSEESIANLQKSLSLYRRLLSRFNASHSEEEVIRFVVDSVFDHFPEHRTSFSRVSPEGLVTVLYCREASGPCRLIGRNFDLAPIPGLLETFRQGNMSVISDVRDLPGASEHMKSLFEFGGSVSRIDIPFFDFEQNLYALSLTHPTPVSWSTATLDLLKEISELVGLMLREARTQARLRRSETLFRQFAENVQVVFWMTDISKMEMVYVSPSFEKIWGRSAESLYKNPLSFIEAIHSEDRERVRAAIMRQADEQYEQSYRVVRPDGEIRWVKDRGFRVRDEAGRVHRIAGIAEDITPLRQAQDRLEATKAQVVTNAKFAALGEMASGVAHEINNPLAVIHGLSVQMQELFRNKSASIPMVIDSLGTIEKMANRIAVIVKGMRTFSRQTAGDPMVRTDLNAIVQETLVLCEARLRAANIEVKLSLPMTHVWIDCRPAEISQVLLNLISNAYDAVSGLQNGAIVIRVDVVDGTSLLSVEDSGIGIAPEIRDRIFQPFFTSKEVGKGTGLGLSISKGIVESHEGSLFLDTGSKSTKFVVKLPSVTI